MKYVQTKMDHLNKAEKNLVNDVKKSKDKPAQPTTTNMYARTLQYYEDWRQVVSKKLKNLFLDITIIWI
jgi:hypothetical protein